MNISDFRKLLPPSAFIDAYLEERHVKMIKLVTHEDILAATLQLLDLPESYRLRLFNGKAFCGFDIPDLGYNFIEAAGVHYPNRAGGHTYPNPLDLSIEQLMSHDYHWVWFGAVSGVQLWDGQPATWATPRTTYRKGNRHVAIAARWLFMAPATEPNCPICGCYCLRPDHWLRMQKQPRGRTVAYPHGK